jgi:hypothetical protein
MGNRPRDRRGSGQKVDQEQAKEQFKSKIRPYVILHRGFEPVQEFSDEFHWMAAPGRILPHIKEPR